MQMTNYLSDHQSDIRIDSIVSSKQNKSNDRFAIKCKLTSLIFNKQDILYISADSNYSTLIFSNGQKVYTSKTLKYWEQRLYDVPLLRSHKSFSVNLTFVLKINSETSEVQLMGGAKIPISRSLRKSVFNSFN